MLKLALISSATEFYNSSQNFCMEDNFFIENHELLETQTKSGDHNNYVVVIALVILPLSS